MSDDTFLIRVRREMRPPDAARAPGASVIAQARALTDRLRPEPRRHVGPGRPSGGGQHAVGAGD